MKTKEFIIDIPMIIFVGIFGIFIVLGDFAKKDLTNYCLMYNYMRTIKQIRKEPEDKLLDERLKKQADAYKKKKKKK